MRNHNSLQITEHALDLALLTYEVTGAFPRVEQFGLTSQMQRASISVGSNIAEGCGRWSDQQLLHSLEISSGSASELEFQATVAHRLTFGDAQLLMQLIERAAEQRRMNLGFAKWLQRR